jgi:hypothetical protein
MAAEWQLVPNRPARLHPGHREVPRRLPLREDTELSDLLRTPTGEKAMDHQEQHHQHHRKEREEEKKHEAQRERDLERKGIHPGWFFGIGAVLVLVAILIWTALT